MWFESRLKATGETAGGSLVLLENLTAPGGGPPPHVHTREDDFWHVLDGTLDIRIGDEMHAVGPGGFAYLGLELCSITVGGDPLGDTAEALLSWNVSPPDAATAAAAAGLPLTPEVIAVRSQTKDVGIALGPSVLCERTAVAPVRARSWITEECGANQGRGP
jgi:hypothetical protein